MTTNYTPLPMYTGSTSPGSDKYRDPYHNYMMMSTSTFRGFYGLDDGYGGTNYQRAGALVGSFSASGSSEAFSYSIGVNGTGDGNGNIIPGTEVYHIYVDKKTEGVSSSDMILAGIGTLSAIGEKLSQYVLNSRSGYSSGKMFRGSPFNYSKASAKNFKTGFKLGGWALALYGIYNTRAQYRAGLIGEGRRDFNYLNTGTGVFFPYLAIPIATGDYLGQTYADEIYNTTVKPGGFIYEATKWMIESLGIQTQPK